ncbi:MAG TPA: hypothetical protein VIX58_07480 [Anaerolineae bacterium]
MTESKPMHILGLSPLAWVMNILILILLCAILALPPISLIERVTTIGYTKVTTNDGAVVQDAGGTTLVIPSNAVGQNSAVKLGSLAAATFVNDARAQSLPASIQLKSPVFEVGLKGEPPKEANLTIPLPNDSGPLETLDLYGQFNNLWFKLPFSINTSDNVVQAQLNFVPALFVIAQTQPAAPVIGGQVTTKNPANTPVRALVSELNPTGLFIGAEGTIAGDVVPSPELSANAGSIVIPTISNLSAQNPRVDLVENMLFDNDQRKIHVSMLTDFAVQKLYNGINIDYRGLSADDRTSFTLFIKELASSLHGKNKTLSLVLPSPKQLSEDQWDTAGYDWALLGRYADEVKITLPADPASYTGNSPLVVTFLNWAVGQADRYKLQVLFSPLGTDTSGKTAKAIAYSDALNLFGSINAPQPIEPKQQVTLDLPKLREVGGIKYSTESGLYSFSYKDDKSAVHTVVMENADSLGRKLALATRFNLRGVVLGDIDKSDGTDTRVWSTLKKYQAQQQIDVSSNLAVLWLLNGNPIGKSPTGDPKYSWTAPETEGNFTLAFALTADGTTALGDKKLGETPIKVALKPTPTPTPKPTLTPTPKPVVANANPAPAAPAAPRSNFTGRNLFGYGIQVNWGGADREKELGEINSLGFGWAKIQVRWCDVESARGAANPGAIDDFVNRANAHGVQVMASIVCAPGWSRSDGGAGGSGPPDDMQLAADFMGRLAERYCGKGLGAIEVWNEHNLLTEWHGKPLSADLYMDMLRRSYAAIKAKCPSIVVVSGAPTPTGWNDGVVAIDDGLFLEQLYQRGLKQYSDAIGAHPSGFNVPALCNVLDPACNRPGVSFAAPFQSRHHSWGFLSTMTTYREIMVRYGDGAKQIWATEFGWPVGTGGSCGGGPCHPAGADNSPDNLAEWFPQSFQWAKRQGYVGVMFVWNLDFYGGEVGAFHIEGQPAFAALQAMPK